MNKLVITITCDSTMSYPRNPHNPKGIEALAEEYVRSVNAGASICHLHGPYTVDEKIRADGTKLSDLDIPGWLRLKELITSRVKPIIQYGIANGRFPQRVELMKQHPDMMSICFNAHDECFQPDPDYPPVELYGIHDREELENYCRLTKQYGVKPEVESFHYGALDRRRIRRRWRRPRDGSDGPFVDRAVLLVDRNLDRDRPRPALPRELDGLPHGRRDVLRARCSQARFANPVEHAQLVLGAVQEALVFVDEGLLYLASHVDDG
jgi:hypothetical protein